MFVDDEHVGMTLHGRSLQMWIVVRKAEMIMLDYLGIIGRPYRSCSNDAGKRDRRQYEAIVDKPVEFPSHPAVGSVSSQQVWESANWVANTAGRSEGCADRRNSRPDGV
jgi:hypothetical protein